jgi:LDH2 family malate/lactate/ureidoglycolate dehydrogenase
MDDVIDQIHGSALAPGSDRIYVPGEIEYETARSRRDQGIPLEEAISRDLNALLVGVGAPLLV